uniref:Galectin n=1 Tax=Romanomermis culicivorax TaxID=13658 RepID=A0A915HV76_ROMCU
MDKILILILYRLLLCATNQMEEASRMFKMLQNAVTGDDVRTFFSEEGKIQKIRNDNPFPRYQNVDLCLLSTSDSSFKIHINGTLYDTFTLSQANNED